MHATPLDASDLGATLDQLEADTESFMALDPFDREFNNKFLSLKRRRAEVEAYLVAEVARYDARLNELAELEV